MSRSTDVASAYDARAITPSDTVALTNGACRAVYVGTTGNIVALMASGNVATFLTVPVGVFPIQVTRINSTSTTASNLVALY
jgi:hypothetical protein